ncbi:hypothetical protein FJZ20_00945, partial [Candidatus Pacearchaeota archaeon]|nr:hypothetical protein [Candidatus Pacearchaeota archaeon]
MAKRKKTKKRIKEEKEKKIEKKKQAEYQNKFLKIFLISAFAIIIFILIFAFISYSKKNFRYEGVEFNIVEFCDAGPPCLKTYNTKVPFIYEDKPASYNFFLRNDPRI